MGMVYKARQRSLERIVAIKVLRPEYTSDPTALAQFKLEANSVATLKHANILLVHEAGQTDGKPYFVMEYVSAYSVSTWLVRKGVLSENDALTIADSVARALQYAWDKAGLVHCDLKPGNILVDEDGMVKVADFSGISRSNMGQEAALLRDVTIGTPNYMAPEQVRGFDSIDFRVDIYSLGGVIYHLVTGVLPFENFSVDDTMKQQVEGQLTDPTEVNPAVSYNAALLVEKMMVKDRDQRYAGWDAVVADIARVRAGQPPAGPLPYPGASTLRIRPRSTSPAPAGAGHAVSSHSPAPPKVKGPPVFAPVGADPAPAAQTNKAINRRIRIAVLATLAVVFVLADLALLFLWDKSPLARKSRSGVRPEPLNPPTATTNIAPPVVPPHPPATNRPRPAVPVPAKPPVTPAPVEPVVPVAPTSPPPEVAVAPTNAPPVEPAPEVQAAAKKAEAWRAYLRVLQEVITQCSRRRYDAAGKMLQEWIAANPDHPQRAAADLDAQRVTRAAGLMGILEQNPSRVLGKAIESTPGVAGTVSGVRAGKITLSRRLGEGFAQVDYALTQLSAQDLATLLQYADARGPLNAVAFLVAEGQFTAADTVIRRIAAAGSDVRTEQQWLSDWQTAVMNVRADRAVEDVRGKLQDSQFRDAADLLETARTTYGRTDIFQWVRAEEIARLDKLIADETSGGATKPPPEATPGPKRDTPAAPPPDAGADDIEQMSVAELSGRIRQLDQRLVRIRFRYRGTISDAGPNLYSTELSMDGESVRVEFSQDGYRWLKNSVAQYQSDSPQRIVYGIVDGQRRTVKLLGRTRKTKMGNLGYDFQW